MDATPRLKLLIADDQHNVRAALRLRLGQEPDLQVVGEVADAIGLLRATRQVAADMLLLDWELPGLPPDQLLTLLHYERPDLRIIAMSGRPEQQADALRQGAAAFIDKGAPPEMVMAAIRATGA